MTGVFYNHRPDWQVSDAEVFSAKVTSFKPQHGCYGLELQYSDSVKSTIFISDENTSSLLERLSVSDPQEIIGQEVDVVATNILRSVISVLF